MNKRISNFIYYCSVYFNFFTFNYKVYLKKQVNAFALADGTIRIYSGLMDMLDDGELRFVIGHEMGHIVKEHTLKQIRLAYAARAVRKGIASQYGAAGDIARSQLAQEGRPGSPGRD